MVGALLTYSSDLVVSTISNKLALASIRFFVQKSPNWQTQQSLARLTKKIYSAGPRPGKLVFKGPSKVI